MAQANVRSIEALREFRTSLGQFRDDAGTALDGASRELDRSRAHLQQKYDAARLRAQECERKLLEAREALRRCQNSGSRDDRRAPDCSAQMLAVRSWQRALDVEREKMARIRALQVRVEEAAQQYLREAQRLNAWLQRDLEQGRALLDRKIQQLESYVATQSAGAAIGAAVGTVLAAGAVAAIGGAAALIAGASGSDTIPVSHRREPGSFDDWAYHDGKGRALVQRVHRVTDDIFYVRLYPEGHDPAALGGFIGQADCTVREETDGSVRLRLMYIETAEAYRGAGNGAHLLERVEEIGRAAGTSEVYGDPPGDDATLAWYGRRGWGLSSDGARIFKRLD